MAQQAECPPTVTIKARDVKPYHFGMWCTVGGGRPLVNEIVVVCWTDDGKRIKFMLGSHNFWFGDPDEVLDLVPIEPSAYFIEKYGDWQLPSPKGAE